LRNKSLTEFTQTLENKKLEIYKIQQMTKKSIIGIIVSLIGLMMMGFEMGRSSKNGESNELLHYGGLFIVFVGAFIVVTFNKKKVDKQ
jgi:hypothetical protein